MVVLGTIVGILLSCSDKSIQPTEDNINNLEPTVPSFLWLAAVIPAEFAYAKPVIDEHGNIYFESRDLHAYKPDGTRLWKFPLDEHYAFLAIGLDSTVIVTTNENKTLYAVKYDGSLRWQFQTPANIYKYPAIAENGDIYFGTGWPDGSLYSVSQHGTLNWKVHLAGGIGSSPVIDVDGTIYVGSNDSNLYAINPDGTNKWEYETEFQVRSSPAIGKDGTIFVGSWNTYMYALDRPVGDFVPMVAVGTFLVLEIVRRFESRYGFLFVAIVATNTMCEFG